jgi:hypothetical protein
MITCDVCKQSGKGRYKSFYIEEHLVTMCDECRLGKRIKRNGKSMNQLFDELQTPFWKMMGAKPKPKDVVLERYLKSRGMSYGDWRRERDFKENARYQSALPQYEAHVKKYGNSGQPPPEYKRGS